MGCFSAGAVLAKFISWVDFLDLRGVTKDFSIAVVLRFVGLVAIGAGSWSATVVIRERDMSRVCNVVV